MIIWNYKRARRLTLHLQIWKILRKIEGPQVEYLSTLSKHTQAVNVVRFDPSGKILATAGDDGAVLLWTKSDSIVKEFGQDPEEFEDIKESWVLRHACRSGSSEVYDLAWSHDSKYIVTGSTDNISRIYDANSGQQITQIAEHSHFVQGVAFDPLGKFIATQSADRSVHIYILTYNNDNQVSISPTIFYKISRAELPSRNPIDIIDNEKSNITEVSTHNVSISPPLPAVRTRLPPSLNFSSLKSSQLYHTENLESFFRRLTFSPDGNYLFTPSGIFKNSHEDNTNADLINTVYIYSRYGLNKPPIAHLPRLKKPAVAVSFSPLFYELDNSNGPTSTIFKLPYKLVYAVATQDSVLIYDTQYEDALGSVSNIHYRSLTDLTWNANGNSIIVSSADGFCTSLEFKEGEFGKRLKSDHNISMNYEPQFSTNESCTSTMKSPSLELRNLPSFKNTIVQTKTAATENRNAHSQGLHENKSTQIKNRINDVFSLMKSRIATSEKEVKGIENPSHLESQEGKNKTTGETINILNDKVAPEVIHRPPVKKKKVAPTLLIPLSELSNDGNDKCISSVLCADCKFDPATVKSSSSELINHLRKMNATTKVAMNSKVEFSIYLSTGNYVITPSMVELSWMNLHEALVLKHGKKQSRSPSKETLIFICAKTYQVVSWKI
ncbi:hypothetical protein WICMUC_005119 [Wickerhamomyces mucosus]|uniref:CAF1B/HIR1 beta-propeller domain-containing protein n=1 Tax=Wickerhamomyces mucosus TaxID=1378264 RepID=A0A9P8T8B1_9ASCO|nr:hypothetical protein WICMUC_005119 [Wickerhamomyces mucosus]